MDYLAAVRAFVRAVDLGSFSKAAVEQELKVSTVSRYVSGLEADLGVALLNRSTRRLHLTEGGADFYRRAVAILAEVEEARLAMHTLNASPRGVLRVNIPSAFGRRHIVPHLKDFHDLHPQVRLDISLTDTVVNLIETGTDVAIRIGALEDSTLVAKKLAPQRRIPVASPDYLGRHGAPSQPNDLTRHACLILAPQQGETWYFRRPVATEFANIIVSGDVRANEIRGLVATGARWFGHRLAADMDHGGRTRGGSACADSRRLALGHRLGAGTRHLGRLSAKAHRRTEGACLSRFLRRAFRPAALLGARATGT